MKFWPSRKKIDSLTSSAGDLLWAPDEGPSSSGGYDQPVPDTKSDRLDRVRLSEHVLKLLTLLPEDFSIRVGIVGPWGDGKTTIARWASNAAESEGHLVVWFNPWSVRTADQMWVEFIGQLIKSAEKRKIELPISKRLKAYLGIQKWSARVGDIGGAAWSPVAIVRHIGALFRLGADDVAEIRQALGAKRTIIVIDDLDRTDPKILPELLLALREFLDLPGFSFLLPFDQTVVSRALASYNLAWGDGERFLDKILDYRVHLPPLGALQRRILFDSELALNCPFFPRESSLGIEEVLPDNARRIKAIVRSLIAFGPLAKRHRPGEVDWKSLVFGTMLRLESEVFYREYVTSTFGPAKPNHWLSVAVGQEKSKDEELSRLKLLLQKSCVESHDKQTSILAICEKWRSLHGLGTSDRVSYALRLLDYQDAIPWG